MKKCANPKHKGGFLSGIVYGLIAHIGCIGFIIFSILGVTTAASVFRPLLLNYYFFHILIVISLIFATGSAVLYLRKHGLIDLKKESGAWEIQFVSEGVKKEWKYLTILYTTTVGINLFLFMLVFPVVANIDSGTNLTSAISSTFRKEANIEVQEGENYVELEVAIPCPGHAPLIRGDLQEIEGVTGVQYRMPDYFDVTYLPEKTSTEEIVSLEVFRTYKAEIVEEETMEGLVNSSTEDNTLNTNPDGCGCIARSGTSDSDGCAGGCCGF